METAMTIVVIYLKYLFAYLTVAYIVSVLGGSKWECVIAGVLTQCTLLFMAIEKDMD
jgi:hypothetical protein